MVRRWDPINDRQADLMERIADGDTLSTAEDLVHRQSAYALRDRALITTEKRGGVFTAEITDAGRFYLRHRLVRRQGRSTISGGGTVLQTRQRCAASSGSCALSSSDAGSQFRIGSIRALTGKASDLDSPIMTEQAPVGDARENQGSEGGVEPAAVAAEAGGPGRRFVLQAGVLAGVVAAGAAGWGVFGPEAGKSAVPDVSRTGPLPGSPRSVTGSPDSLPTSTTAATTTAATTPAAPTSAPPTSPRLLALQTTLTGHVSYVAGLAFAPDGRTLASAGCDATTRLWDLTSSDPAVSAVVFQELGRSTSNLTGLAMSRDGKMLANAGFRDAVDLYSIAGSTGALAASIRPGTSGGAPAVAFSPDGRTLAVVTVEVSQGVGVHDGKVRLYDVVSRREPVAGATIPFPGPLDSAAFSPDGRVLAVGGYGAISLWDVGDPHHPARLGGWDGHEDDFVPTLSFSADGRMLASGSTGGLARVWNVETPASMTVQAELGADLGIVAFSPVGRTVAGGTSGDPVTRVWDVSATGHPVVVAAMANPVGGLNRGIAGLAFRPDGAAIATGGMDGVIRIWGV